MSKSGIFSVASAENFPMGIEVLFGKAYYTFAPGIEANGEFLRFFKNERKNCNFS